MQKEDSMPRPKIIYGRDWEGSILEDKSKRSLGLLRRETGYQRSLLSI
jgi:hypothetical protein